MSGIGLNFLILMSGFGVFFFLVLGVMAFFKSEALQISEENRINNTIKLGVTAGLYLITYIGLSIKKCSQNRCSDVPIPLNNINTNNTNSNVNGKSHKRIISETSSRSSKEPDFHTINRIEDS